MIYSEKLEREYKNLNIFNKIMIQNIANSFKVFSTKNVNINTTILYFGSVKKYCDG